MIRFVLADNERFGRLISGSGAFLRRWDDCSVTVIGSVVVGCLLCVELVWANASGAISHNDESDYCSFHDASFSTGQVSVAGLD